MEILFGFLGLVISAIGVYVAYRQLIHDREAKKIIPMLSYERVAPFYKHVVLNDIVTIQLNILNKSEVGFQGRITEIIPSGTTLVEGNLIWSGNIDPNQTISLKYSLRISEEGEITFGKPLVNASGRVKKQVELSCERSLNLVAEGISPATILLTTQFNSTRLAVGQTIPIILKWNNGGSEAAHNLTYRINCSHKSIVLLPPENDYAIIIIDRFSCVEQKIALKATEAGEYTITLQDIQYADSSGKIHNVPPYSVHLKFEFGLNFIPVGRERELGTLLARIDNAKNCTGKLIIIHGEAGVGKTYLLETAIERAREQGFLCFEASCEPFNEAWAFYPFRRIFDEYFSLVDRETVVERTSKAQAKLISLSPDLQPYIPILTQFLIGNDPNNQDQATLIASPRDLRGQFLLASYSLFETIACKCPLIIFIDDLQYADSGTVDLIQYIASRISSLPMLILGAVRTEEMSHARRGQSHPLQKPLQEMRIDGRVEEIFLKTLSKDDCHSLMVSFFQHSDFPLDLGDILFEETEGNPLYIREVLKSLMERGCIIKRSSDGIWILAEKVEALDVPNTIEELIKMRLSLLKDEETRELEKASVIGREFAYQLLKDLSERDEDILIGYLEEYLDYRIIEELDERDETYRFTHGKIQEVIYKEIQSIRRRKLHCRVAELLEVVYSNNLVKYSPIIAHHFYFGGDNERALKYLTITGIENARVYANDEAIRSFEIAIEILAQKLASAQEKASIPAISNSQILMTPVEIRSQLRENIAQHFDKEELYTLCFDLGINYDDLPADGVTAKSRELVAYCERHGTLHELIQKCALRQPRFFNRFVKGKSSQEQDDDFSSMLRSFLDIKYRLGSVYREINDFSKAEELYGEALSIAEQLNDLSYVGLLMSRMAEAYAIWGDYENAEQFYTKTLELVQQTNDSKLHLQLLNDYADLYWWKCRAAAAKGDSGAACDFTNQILVNAKQALEMAQQLGDQNAIVRSYKNLGNYSFLSSKYSDALRYFEDGIRVADTYNLMPSKYVYEKAGKLYRLMGRIDEAIDVYNKYLGWATQIGAQWAQLKAYQVLGLTAFNKGEFVRALELLDQSMVLNTTVKSKNEDIETLIIKGQVLDALERYEEGMECYRLALKLRGVPKEDVETQKVLKLVGMEMSSRGEFVQAKNLFARYQCLAPDLPGGEQQEIENLLSQCDTLLEQMMLGEHHES